MVPIKCPLKPTQPQLNPQPQNKLHLNLNPNQPNQTNPNFNPTQPQLNQNPRKTKLVGGWTTHLKNMLVKMGASSPIFGVTIPKIFELPPPS